MNELPENLKSAMEQYAKAHADLQNDQVLKQAQFEYDRAVTEAKRQLDQHDYRRQKYLTQISGLEEYIKAQVMELGSTAIYAGVKAQHRSGYERVTWDNQMMTSIIMDNPALAAVFKPARKVTDVKPAVTISLTNNIGYTREDAEADIKARENAPF